MRRFALAIALTCVLSGTTLAGDVASVNATTPAPTSSGVAQTPGITATIILTIISLISR